MGASLFFVFFGIRHSFGIDEAASVEVAAAPLAQIAGETALKTGSPPLYYFLLSFWMKMFGMNEAASRSLSALFYLLSIPAMYVLGRTLFDGETGLLGAFLFLLSPVAVHTVQNTRMYSLMGLLTVLSLLYYLKLFFQKPALKSDEVKYVLVNAVGTWTHYWFFFLLAAQAVCFLLFFRPGNFKKFSLLFLLALVPFTFWVPGFLEQMRTQPGAMWWAPNADVGLLLSTFLGFFGVGQLGLLVYAAMAVLVVLRINGLKPRLQDFKALRLFVGQKLSLSLLSITLVSLLVPWLISQAKPIYAWNKYTIIAFPSLALFLGALLTRFAQRGLLLVFCFALLGGAAAGYAYQKSRFHKHTDKTTADFLMRSGAAGDALVFGGSSRSVLEYYLRLRKQEGRFLKTSFPAEMERHPGWSDPAAMMARKTELEKEADSLVEQLVKTLGKESKIWLIYGYYPEIEGIVKDRFDQSFHIVEEIVLEDPYCTFYDRIRIYRKRSETGVSS